MKALKYFTLAFGILAANTVLLQILTTIGIPAFSAKIIDGDHTFYRQYVGTTIPDIYA